MIQREMNSGAIRGMRPHAVEILAPAGSYSSAIAAINAGADAVYTGGPVFGARAYADNPDTEQLKSIIDYAHLHGRAVYLALNTLLKTEEMGRLYDYLEPLYCHGLDAVIVQDTGVFSYVKQCFPDIDIHCSTQMTVTGRHGVSFLQQAGASRVVLARELMLHEIADIYEHTHAELECFVHGALCYCYSGQCLYSSFIGGRSGNRGRCAQPCRLPYRLKGKEAYYMSPKDICTLEILPELIEAGIYSLKIEGRMKRMEYSAGVTRIYRKYLDMYSKYGAEGYQVDDRDLTELMDLYNRGGFSKGYYHMNNGRGMMALDRPNHQGVCIGKIDDCKGQELIIRPDKEVNPGDILEVRAKRSYEFTVGRESVKNGQLRLRTKDMRAIQKGAEIYRTCNKQLLEELSSKYCNNIQEKINGKLILRKENPVTLYTEYGSLYVNTQGAIPQKAQKQPLTEERVRKIMNKTGNTPFSFKHLEVDMEEDIFMPVQQLNELKRSALKQLEENTVCRYRRMPGVRQGILQTPAGEGGRSPRIHVSLEHPDMVSEVCRSLHVSIVSLDLAFLDLEQDYEVIRHAIQLIKSSGKECRLFLPHIFRGETEKKYEQHKALLTALNPDIYIARSFDSYAFLRELGFSDSIMLDYNMYTFQNNAEEFWRIYGTTRNTVPLELNWKELRQRGCTGSEIIAYGYIPVMITAGCPAMTVGQCTGRQESYILEDRKHKKFRVRNCCLHCYNLMYNCSPLYLLDQLEELGSLQPESVRLIFTTEGKEQMPAIIEDAVHGLREGRKPRRKPEEFTRGHFMRGIE